MIRGALAVLLLCLAVASARPAHADVAWAAGVPADKQKSANALFAEANQLFAQQAHPAALEKYRAAIALWDHPLIRFNMAVTLIRLDRILEAADALDAALRFGEAPFPRELYGQAVDYQKLIAGRIGYVEASCDQKSVQVLLDSKSWFTCPGSRKVRVTAGEHVVAASRETFIPITRRVIVPGGGTASEKVKLMPADSTIAYEYPTARWIPWGTVGAGIAIGVGGLGVYFAGRSQLDQFRADYLMRCPSGCQSDLSDVPDLARDRDSANLKGTIGMSMMIAGGAMTVGGLIWATVINRPQRVTPKFEVLPSVGGVTATARWTF